MKRILLSNRLKSFYWRTGMLCLAAVVGVLLEQIQTLAPYISPAFIGILGLILGECSKAINNYATGK